MHPNCLEQYLTLIGVQQIIFWMNENTEGYDVNYVTLLNEANVGHSCQVF